MKRILAAAFAALLSFSAFAATLTPIQLLQPAGSTSGQFITSTGPSTAPAWSTVTLSGLGGVTAAQAAAAAPVQSVNGSTGAVTVPVAGRLLNIQVFTTTSTYTPTTGATKAKVRVMAPGGGSGGNPATSTGQTAMSGPGNAGAYGEIWIASGLATQTVTIGAPGAAGSASPGAGGTGGTTSFGSLIACLGGAGGPIGAATANTTSFVSFPSATVATCSGTGTFLVSGTGASGEKGFLVQGQVEFPGSGASTMWGQGGQGRTIIPAAGTGYGAGAGAFYVNPSSAATAGTAGAPGIVIIEEFN